MAQVADQRPSGLLMGGVPTALTLGDNKGQAVSAVVPFHLYSHCPTVLPQGVWEGISKAKEPFSPAGRKYPTPSLSPRQGPLSVPWGPTTDF